MAAREPGDDTTTPLGGDGVPGLRTEELAQRHTFTIGSLVSGRYRIDALLGKGGMGEVYRAEDMLLHQPVALKTVRAAADNEEARARFRREIQLARKVAHPHVCRIFDVGAHEQNLFLTMELLEGDTLAERIGRDGPVPLADARAVAADVAAALDAAHREGVIHRDLKSSNIIFAHGRARVTDFGLAREAAELPESHVTGEGVMIGSPAYMAPEQVEGQKHLTPAADIYSFGVVLYEMVTGRVPFREDTGLKTALARLRQAPPSPRQLAPYLPLGWERAILGCLERDPARRWRSASEAVAELGARRPGRWKKWALAAALAVAAATAWAWLRTGPRGRAEPSSAVAGLYQQGMAQLRGRACVLARPPLEQVVARDPGFALGHVALAEALSCVGQETRARAQAQLGVELAADLGPEARDVATAQLAVLDGDGDRAVRLYRGLVNRSPRFDDALRLAELEIDLQTGQPQETISLLRKLPEGSSAVLDWLEARLLLGDPRPALAALARARERAAAQDLPFLVAEIRIAEAMALGRVNDLPAAYAAVRHAKEIYLAGGDSAGVLNVLGLEIAGYRILGDAEAVKRIHAEAHDIGEALDSQGWYNFAINLAYTMRTQGDLDGARAVLDELRDWARRRGRVRDEAWALQQTSRFSLDAADALTSARQMSEAIALVAGRYPVQVAELKLSLAVSLALQGNSERAIRLEQEGLSASSYLVQNGTADWVAGIVASCDGRYGDAAESLRRALARRRHVHGDAIAIHLLLVRALVEHGSLEEARSELAAAEKVVSSLYPDVYYRSDLELTRQAVAIEGRRPEDLVAAGNALAEQAASSRRRGFHLQALTAELYLGRALRFRGRNTDADAVWRRVAEEAGRRSLALFARFAERAGDRDGRW